MTIDMQARPVSAQARSSDGAPAEATGAEQARTRARAALAADALRSQLRQQGRATLSMRGRSMWPVLRPGTDIELRPVRSGERLRGAVVAFEGSEAVVVHRVRAVRGQIATCRGIARRQDDRPIHQDSIIGVVTRAGRLPERPLRAACAAIGTAIYIQRRIRERLVRNQ